MSLHELLKSKGLIDRMTEEQYAKLAEIAELRTFMAEDNIISEITRSRDLYLIKSGVVSIKMSLPTEAKKSEIIDRLHAGDIMGEIAFIDGSPRSATIVAEEDTEVYLFPYEKLHDLMESDPRLGYLMITGIAKILTAKVRQTNLAWRNLMMW
ncbi:Crp/Fnr family transcriptional regulator [Calditrichota bacterium]